MKRIKPRIHSLPPLVFGLMAAFSLAACNRPDGQMSDRQAAEAPKESASLGAALDDTAITAKVKQRLASDDRVKNADIDVETNNGVVTLSGTAADGDAKAAAEELARNVESVRGIDNRIGAPSMLDTATADVKDAAADAKAGLSDASITAKVKARFAEDEQVKATEISVETDHGVVTLKGQVPSPDARQRAELIARETHGVKAVRADDLKVVRPS